LFANIIGSTCIPVWVSTYGVMLILFGHAMSGWLVTSLWSVLYVVSWVMSG